MQRLEVCGAARHIYVVRWQKVKELKTTCEHQLPSRSRDALVVMQYTDATGQG
jgi:hypothetical protein